MAVGLGGGLYRPLAIKSEPFVERLQSLTPRRGSELGDHDVDSILRSEIEGVAA